MFRSSLFALLAAVTLLPAAPRAAEAGSRDDVAWSGEREPRPRACRPTDCFGIPEGYCSNGAVPQFSCRGVVPRCQWVVRCPDGDEM
jgi:hypothetical protein